MRIFTRHELFVFPLAVLLNTFSMTALLLVFGLVGRVEIAADIGLVQGASIALFFAFSANARNLILAASSDFGRSVAASLLQVRLLLLFPLSCAAFFLSVGVGGVAASLAIVLILRRGAEWVGEIALARQEMLGCSSCAQAMIIAEFVGLLACVVAVLAFDFSLAPSALLWALTPLFAVRGASLSLWGRGVALRSMLPHFGSTGIIGASVYVFRISVILLAGKVLAGTLFTAFAIGGLVPTLFGQALVPTLVRRYGLVGVPRVFLVIPMAMLCVGGALAAIAMLSPRFLPMGTLPEIFWLAVGLSIVGGAIMSVASVLRTRLIHSQNAKEVFGPDLLANVLIATSVPFVYFVFGPDVLAWLYLLSAFLNLAFLCGVDGNFRLESRYRRSALYVLAGMLIFPIFFQIDGGLFCDQAFVFDAQGSVVRVPLPLSIMAVFLGIGILGCYGAASRTLSVLFCSALILIMTSLIAAEGNSAQEGAKLILLAQYLLPMFGLILGEMYGATTREPICERVALWVFLFILPLQVIATWMSGYTLLIPKVFIFSIYQHLQYFPMIASTFTMLALISLWTHDGASRHLIGLLAAITAMYAVASTSFGAVVGVIVGLCGFVFFHFHDEVSRRQSVQTLVAVVACALCFLVVSTSGWLDKIMGSTGLPVEQMTLASKLSEMASSNFSSGSVPSVGHFEFWRQYGSAVTESVRTFLIGHPMPPDRSKMPSAHNYWLDVAYNFGVLALIPLLGLLVWTSRSVWKLRVQLRSDQVLFATTLAVSYLVLFENMIKVGMRQPYPGIITFFLWGLLIARLRNPAGVGGGAVGVCG